MHPSDSRAASENRAETMEDGLVHGTDRMTLMFLFSCALPGRVIISVSPYTSLLTFFFQQKQQAIYVETYVHSFSPLSMP